MSAILELKAVSCHFGGVLALDHISFALHEGEIVGLIGPNGAGKTTLVNVVTGVHKASDGEITFSGRRIEGMKSHRISRMGISRTFQVVQPFPRMSVLENVAAGAMFAGHASTPGEAKRLAQEHLEFVGLNREAEKSASALTLAGRKRLELAKSLAMRPRLLMLDEVNSGLNPTEIDGALDLIRAIADRGVTILVIEHLMRVVLNVCNRVLVVKTGKLIADGSTQEVVNDRQVIEAYLGKRYASTIGEAG